MVLWIRSQDRQDLIAVSRHLHIQETSVNPHSHKWGILLDGGRYIGEYNSEERAIEVLDEIQNMIAPTLITTEYHSEINQGIDKLSFDVTMQPVEDKITYIQPNTVIYEMPQE